MSDIMHAAGYLSGAVGIGFAVAFGMYAGLKVASWWLGPLKIDLGPVNMNLKLRDGDGRAPND